MIRSYEPADWPAVERIYLEGIATGDATFEAEPPTQEVFEEKVLKLVADDGWVAASRVSGRDVYRGVVEHSVYVSEAARGRGVGGQLLDALEVAAVASGIWTIQSSVFPENEVSLTLHAAHGYRVVGRRERIALMSYGPYVGQWRDTVLIEKRLAGH